MRKYSQILSKTCFLSGPVFVNRIFSSDGFESGLGVESTRAGIYPSLMKKKSRELSNRRMIGILLSKVLNPFVVLREQFIVESFIPKFSLKIRDIHL